MLMPKQVRQVLLLLLLLEATLVSSFSPFERQVQVQQAGSLLSPHQTHRLRRCQGRARAVSRSSYLDSLAIIPTNAPEHPSLKRGDDSASTLDVDELAKKYGLTRDGPGREGYDEASDASGQASTEAQCFCRTAAMSSMEMPSTKITVDPGRSMTDAATL
mmetsp:Transcript_19215/g.44961  ORF Transcript_19215/g.44961 Transcript_19215/m.44961 type:complete len:160 (+) Transcript_19215:128-607(+)